MDPSPAVSRVLTAFSISFPPVVFIAITYICTSDPVFAVNRLIGFRLYRPLRKLGRISYLVLNALMFLGLHFAVASYCGSAEHLFGSGCGRRPPVMHERTSLFLVSASGVAHAFALLIDRVAVPLFAIDDVPGYACGWRARVRFAAGAATLWMAIAEADATALLIVSTQTARRWTGSVFGLPQFGTSKSGAFILTDRIAKISTGLYMVFFKTMALMHAVSVIRDAKEANACSAVQRKLAVAAVLGTLAV